MKMHNLPNLVLAAAMSLGAGISQAGNYNTGWVTITDVGCQTVNTICFASFSGPAVGPPGCVTNQIRWDTASTPNGNAALAQLTAAYLAGKQVSFNMDNDCFAEFPGFPTIDYYNIMG